MLVFYHSMLWAICSIFFWKKIDNLTFLIKETKLYFSTIFQTFLCYKLSTLLFVCIIILNVRKICSCIYMKIVFFVFCLFTVKEIFSASISTSISSTSNAKPIFGKTETVSCRIKVTEGEISNKFTLQSKYIKIIFLRQVCAVDIKKRKWISYRCLYLLKKKYN